VSVSRKHDRVPCRLECWCESQSVTLYARIGNISEGGMFLRTSLPLEQGAVASLRFGAGPAVETRARVCLTRVEGQGGAPGMGLRFEGADEATRGAIRRIVQREQGD
jgi:uncharacterized protein (TIGR02266 family)